MKATKKHGYKLNGHIQANTLTRLNQSQSYQNNYNICYINTTAEYRKDMFSSADSKKVEIKKKSDHPPNWNNHTGTAEGV